MYYILIVLGLLTTQGFAETIPLVKTPLGSISGVYDSSHNGKMYSAFYGIPYAQPPIGNLRFQEPVEKEPWEGIWQANTSGISCIQINHAPVPEGGPLIGEEDCLYLHVFVPSKQPNQIIDLLDVIVHFHGGAFMFGSCEYYAGPRFLMDENVILVTLNYRLGYLGFMSTEDEVVPGNMGMKDQVMALKWVKNNIKSFGGNPDSVTITGLSAGGASVHYHFLSPLSKGLFRKGISTSGSALAPWTFQENSLGKAKFLGAQLGCPTDNTKKMVDCLKTRPAKQIVFVTKLLRPWLFNPFSPLALVVEKEGKNKFLPEHPYVLLVQGKINNAPWLASLTSEEGLYPGADYVLKDTYLPKLEKRWKELAPSILDYNYTIPIDKLDEISETIKKEYLGNNIVSQETYKELIDISTAHGDDMMFILSIPNKRQSLTKLDADMQEILLNIWLTFIKTGEPQVKNVKWPRVSSKEDEPLLQLHIRSPTNITVQDVEQIDRHRSMWNNLPFKENEYFLKITKEEL